MKLTFAEWLSEREANARQIAASKHGIDKAGWMEDAEYFKQAAALAARPVTPAPTLTEAEFTDWFAKNYYGEVVFSDPAWHAKSIYRRARNRDASAPEALTKPWAQKTALGKAPSLIIELETAAERFTRYSNDSIDGLLQEAADVIRALAAPSTPAASGQGSNCRLCVAEFLAPPAATQAQYSLPETLNSRLDELRTIGHGHVLPRADGFKARCGGPRFCPVCRFEESLTLAPSQPAAASTPEQIAQREEINGREGTDEPEALSDEQIEAQFKACGGRWSGDAWVMEDADLHPFVRSILAAPSTPAATQAQASETFEAFWATLPIPGEYDAMDPIDQRRWRDVVRLAFDHIAGTDKMVAADLVKEKS